MSIHVDDYPVNYEFDFVSRHVSGDTEALSADLKRLLWQWIVNSSISTCRFSDLRYRLNAMSLLFDSLRLPMDKHVFEDARRFLVDNLSEFTGGFEELARSFEKNNDIRRDLRVVLDSELVDAVGSQDFVARSGGQDWKMVVKFSVEACDEDSQMDRDCRGSMKRAQGRSDVSDNSIVYSVIYADEKLRETDGAEKCRLAFRIGRILWRLREQKGLTQEVLAGRVGISQPSLSLVERGKREPSLDVLRSLCAELGVRVSTVMAFAENPLENMESFSRELRETVGRTSDGNSPDVSDSEVVRDGIEEDILVFPGRFGQ